VAPKDGTYIGAFVRFYVLHQALGGKGVQYDATKFNYLGSTAVSNVTLGAFKSATAINSFNDLKKHELIVGGTGVGSGTVIFPTVFNAMFGTKLKIVQGYRSGRTIDLAMERGEVKGRAGNTFESINSIHPTWIKSGTVKILIQVGLRKEPGYDHIPLALDLAKNAADREVIKLYSGIVAVGSPIFTNQGVPKARVAALRKAFDMTMKDPAYLADAKKKRLQIAPTGGVELQNIVSSIVNAPEEVISKAKQALRRKGLVKCKSFTSAKYCKSKKKKKKKKS
jgi:tripartite-type tricarboxylate transporter receptor subunit TctC